MTVKLSVSQGLRLSRPGNVSVSTTGIESDLTKTWFMVGFKRTTGAPTTIGDLVAKYANKFTDWSRGSFNLVATGRPTSVAQTGIVLSDLSPAPLAADHMYLIVCLSADDSAPGDSVTFDAIKALGTLAP